MSDTMLGINEWLTEHLIGPVNRVMACFAPAEASAMTQEASALYKDCAALYKAGKTKSGVYTLAAGNSTQRIKVHSGPL